MNTKKDTGGPAFPGGLIDPSTPEDAVQSLHVGMTLRDYFAAKALAGLLTNDDLTYEDEKLRRENYKEFCKDFAWSAYEMADAMLEARNK